jgi:hypothetical protein
VESSSSRKTGVSTDSKRTKDNGGVKKVKKAIIHDEDEDEDDDDDEVSVYIFCI